MSIAGPLLAVGLAFFFAGIYRAGTGPRLFDGWALMALGAAATGAAYQLLSKGVA
jgi:hypothetical protein